MNYRQKEEFQITINFRNITEKGTSTLHNIKCGQ